MYRSVFVVLLSLAVTVENHVDVEFGSHAALDLAEEPQKLLMP